MRALKKYAITLAVGLLLALGIAWAQGVFQQNYLLRVLNILCDAFFASGAVLTAAGILVFTTNEGVFDLLTYGVSSVADRLRKNGMKRYSSFYDYRTAREEKKFPFLHLLICGVFFLAVAVALYGIVGTYI